eukprot:Opistho-2@97082
MSSEDGRSDRNASTKDVWQSSLFTLLVVPMLIHMGVGAIMFVLKALKRGPKWNPVQENTWKFRVLVALIVALVMYEMKDIVMKLDPTCYDDLEVSRTATSESIRANFRKLSLVYHPDKTTGDETKFMAIRKAFEKIGDPKKRIVYDVFGNAAVDCDSCVFPAHYVIYISLGEIMSYAALALLTFLLTLGRKRTEVRSKCYLTLGFLFLFQLATYAHINNLGDLSGGGWFPIPIFQVISLSQQLYRIGMGVLLLIMSRLERDSRSLRELLETADMNHRLIVARLQGFSVPPHIDAAVGIELNTFADVELRKKLNEEVKNYVAEDLAVAATTAAATQASAPADLRQRK